MTHAHTLKLALLLLVLLSGCAGRESFSSTFPVNRRDDLTAALARAKQQGAPQLPQVIVGVTEQPSGVFAYDLSRARLLFHHRADITGVPFPAGPFAVVPEGDALHIRRLLNGDNVFDVSLDGMHLVGAASDGQVTAVVLSTGGSMGARSRLIVLNGEQVTVNRTVDRHLGGPAVLGGHVFVPHNRVHFSILDVQGTELARIQVREDVASQALTFDNEVYFGQAGMYRVDEKTALGASGGALYFKVARDEKLPGQPAFLPVTAEPPPAVNSAVHKVSLSFLPELRDGSIGLLGDTLYMMFYKQLYALPPVGSSAHWVYQTDSDCVGVRAVADGVLLVEQSGTVRGLDRDGRPTFAADMGLAPVVAQVQAQVLPPANVQADAPAPLVMQLVDAAMNPDARLVPVRALAVNMLAELEDDAATSALVELCQDRETPERVRTTACVALSKRKSGGTQAIIAALTRHADFLAQTKAPPVGPLAQAAMAIGDTSVAPYLLSHVADPETPTEELPALMLALKELAFAEAAGPIADFLRLYHAEADEQPMVDALVLAIDILKKLQGAEARGTFELIANDPFAPASIRAAAGRALAELSPTPAPEAQADATPAETEASEPEPEPAGPPEYRTTAHVEQALRPVIVKLSKCVREAPKRPNSARLTVVLDGDGEVLAVETLPPEVKPCVEPLVLSVPFPGNKHGRRETLTYTIPR